jgi:transcription initiation factor TFIIIB Brf1 subunit/transcription initiation factor TFIIB
MKCKKCNSENLVMRPNAKNPSATELICADCGAWQKFIGKEEIRLFEIRNQRSAPKPSNADRIRGMSDEELAKFIKHLDSGLDEICDIQDISQDGNGCDRHENCYACYLDWLKQPAETEGTE